MRSDQASGIPSGLKPTFARDCAGAGDFVLPTPGPRCVVLNFETLWRPRMSDNAGSPMPAARRILSAAWLVLGRVHLAADDLASSGDACRTMLKPLPSLCGNTSPRQHAADPVLSAMGWNLVTAMGD